jgi:hypothetical protein
MRPATAKPRPSISQTAPEKNQHAGARTRFG